MSIIFKSGVLFFGDQKPKPIIEPKPFEEVRKVATLQAEEDSLINKDSIRPKHIEDETISYRSSGYVKDLIEEEE